ncbi:MAG: class D beta-lactamase, partial [Deltaproteobacteria bacterium]|nr:class D beta-lactamase [Deltaproteobacteria bacterium]
ESGDRVWFFATNIDITKPEDSRLRQEVTLEALKAKGII